MASGSLGVAGAHVTKHAGAEHAYVTEPVMGLILAGNHARVNRRILAVATISHVQVRFCPILYLLGIKIKIRNATFVYLS